MSERRTLWNTESYAIYALCDPDAGDGDTAIHYVGCTMDLGARYKAHCKGNWEGGAGRPLVRWIRGLGAPPKMRVLEKLEFATVHEARAKESEWIERLRVVAPLKNKLPRLLDKPSASIVPHPDDSRRKVNIRFTERQWEQLRVYMFKHRVPTLQSLVLSALSDRLDEFDL